MADMITDLNDFLMEPEGETIAPVTTPGEIKNPEENVIDENKTIPEDDETQTPLKEEEEKPNPDPATANEDPESAKEEEVPTVLPFAELLHQDFGFEFKPEEFKAEFGDDPTAIVKFLKQVIADNEPEFASEDVKEFNEYVAKGGSPQDYLTTKYGNTDYENIKLENNIAAQEKVVREFLKLTNPKLTDEKITAKIDKYKDLDALREEAEDALEVLKEKDAEHKASKIKNQEKVYTERQQELQKRNDEFISGVKSSKQLAGFDIQDTEKQKFIDWMTRPGKTGKTGYQEFLDSPEGRRNLAYLAFKGADKSKLIEDVKTEVVNNVAKKLARFTSSGAKGSSVVDAKVQKPEVNYDDFIL